MMDSETRHIHIADYNYPLPSERIAKYPLKERDQSKLLLYRRCLSIPFTAWFSFWLC